MSDWTVEQKLALDHARYLAENGVPLFLAKPDMKGGDWNPSGGHQGTGYWLPKKWQLTEADPGIVDGWEPGMALCAVTGHALDLFDVDPRSGGADSVAQMQEAGLVPRSYGRQATPSDGTHDFIATLGVRSLDKVLAGVDVKAGDGDGQGRGFAFLAPTVKLSKTTGELATYVWVEKPDVELLNLLGVDYSGDKLAELVRSRGHTPANTSEGPDGPSYDNLSDGCRQMADDHVMHEVESWRAKLADAADWPESERDDKGRGWELLARDFAWALAMLAACPWTGLDEDVAQHMYADILPTVIAEDPQCRAKWYDGIVGQAASRPVESPPWDGFETDHHVVDVTNESDALDWLEAEVGRGRLSGVFRRAQELVHTPRIGENGYVEPKDDRDNSGPAQVRRIDALELARRIDHGYSVIRQKSRRSSACLFPQTVAGRASAAPDLLRNARDLLGVTHTPVVRRDGSILDVAGYDDASGMLYLPDPSLLVPKVPDKPTQAEVQQAGKLLLDMVADFPFVTEHDRANYLGALLTPLLRPLVPPPYKLIAIGAPQRGSGKTLLALIMREIHGGVFKSEMPTNDDELRKFITSTLDATTGPVVQFDNVTGVLKSSVLDGLLTSAEWSDRLLGRNDMLNLSNDRLWVVTGNNVHIGGDLERRTLWVTINANMERPEERTEFTIPNLESWVRDHRGKLLWALLTLIRAWVAVGRPTPERPTTDGFGQWVAVLRGILKVAKLGDSVGVVGHADSSRGKADPEDEEWAAFLAAAHRVFGSEPWTARELLSATYHTDFTPKKPQADMLTADELPGDIGERMARSEVAAAKSLGKWLGFRDGRWAGGLSVQSVEVGISKKHAKQWRVVDTSALG